MKRLQYTLQLLEDHRDAAELGQQDVQSEAIIDELNEALEVLRNYAGDTTENGLPSYVGFSWGNSKEKMGRWTKPALRRYQAVQRLKAQQHEYKFTDGMVISTVTELEELRNLSHKNKQLVASIDHYIEYCKKKGTVPFRYKKVW